MNKQNLPDSSPRGLLLRFRGRVQGVGFRYTVQAACNRNGVTGWVRNQANGDVEALLVGADSAIESAVLAVEDAMSQNITRVLKSHTSVRNTPSSFEVLR